LVVEDEPEVLEIAVDALRGLGYRLLTAVDSAAALEILGGKEPIDILFTDVVMPGRINGVQLAAIGQRLRPALKVALTSGYAAAMLVAQHGFKEDTAYLQKPYRAHELAEYFAGIANSA
jgi:CheY-like chemotaxis protein